MLVVRRGPGNGVLGGGWCKTETLIQNMWCKPTPVWQVQVLWCAVKKEWVGHVLCLASDQWQWMNTPHKIVHLKVAEVEVAGGCTTFPVVFPSGFPLRLRNKCISFLAMVHASTIAFLMHTKKSGLRWETWGIT